MKKRTKQGSEIQAVVKSLKILGAFSHNKIKLSLTELSEITGFYKSTILRQTNTLIEYGYLLRNSENEKFQLGPKLYILGQIYAQNSNLVNVATPLINDLASICNETVVLFVVDGFERLCLIRTQSSQFLRAVYEQGDMMPLHAGASGKVLLAYSDESLFEKLIAKAPLSRYGENTITNPDDLRKEFVEIQKKGFALSRSEHAIGVAACASPVFYKNGKLAGAIAINGPVERFEKLDMDYLISKLLETCELVSLRIGTM
ncbi:IclR family transcriptional regulator [Thermodesulfobacteriota bacterium]